MLVEDGDGSTVLDSVVIHVSEDDHAHQSGLMFLKFIHFSDE
jgi:hypothetical protein